MYAIVCTPVAHNIMGRNRWDVLSLLLQPPILAALELAIYDVPILAVSEPAADTVRGSEVCDASMTR